MIKVCFKVSYLPLSELFHYLMAKEVIVHLQSLGHQAYFVGGCVRDLLLGFVPHDWDISTSCPYDELLLEFPYPSHGKITRKFLVHAFDWDGVEIEIAQFREDKGLNRSSVATPGNLKTDSVRRDFTFNAIYWDPISGDFLDPVNGLKDLSKRKLRTTSDPDFVFSQDPIRIVRGLGFQKRYHLKDCVGLNRYKYLLDGINPTRLHQECRKRGVSLN